MLALQNGPVSNILKIHLIMCITTTTTRAGISATLTGF